MVVETLKKWVNWSISCLVLLQKESKWCIQILKNDIYRFGYVGDQNRDFWDDLGMNPYLKMCFPCHWVDPERFELYQSTSGQIWIDLDSFESSHFSLWLVWIDSNRMWINSASIVNIKVLDMDVIFPMALVPLQNIF